jgi:hypothetical protein
MNFERGKFNVRTPDFIRTNLNNYAGTHTVGKGARARASRASRPGRSNGNALRRERPDPVVT